MAATAQMTRTQVEDFFVNIDKKRKTMNAEDRLRYKKVAESVPASLTAINTLRSMTNDDGSNDVDFQPLADMKSEQRFADAGIALEHAVDNGVTTVEDFAQWLHIDHPDKVSVNDIIDTAHAYVRISERARMKYHPEVIAGFLDNK